MTLTEDERELLSGLVGTLVASVDSSADELREIRRLVYQRSHDLRQAANA